MEIRIAKSDKEIVGSYETMSQLRPNIKRDAFLGRVREQEKTGYNLAFGEDEGRVVSAAGFRFVETLAWGKFMYVDDLVTDENQRSKGYGDKMIDWLMAHAKENECREFHLDSGVQRFLAHRFYFRKGMTISCYHFQYNF
ncbi:MAG: GNAT family N-acetyltransferase [Candidatus Omnitrophica bacterium]|nr:GNAT family N-acetyltransferase [Candidatus Omnitrophota bacterium]